VRKAAVGRHEGECAGFPPSGRLVIVTAISIRHIDEGQIQERRTPDAAGRRVTLILNQLQPKENKSHRQGEIAS